MDSSSYSDVLNQLSSVLRDMSQDTAPRGSSSSSTGNNVPSISSSSGRDGCSCTRGIDVCDLCQPLSSHQPDVSFERYQYASSSKAVLSAMRALQARIDKLQGQNRQLVVDMEELQTTHEQQLQQTRAAHQVARQEWDGQLREAQSHIQSLKRQLEQRASDVSQLENVLTSVRSEKAQMNDDLHRVRKLLDEAHGDKRAMEQKLYDLHQQASTDAAEQAVRKIELEQKYNAFRELATRREEELEEEVRALRANVEAERRLKLEYVQKMSHVQQSQAVLAHTSDKHRGEIEVLKQRVGKAKDQVIQYKEIIRALRAELHESRAQKGQLAQAVTAARRQQRLEHVRSLEREARIRKPIMVNIQAKPKSKKEKRRRPTTAARKPARRGRFARPTRSKSLKTRAKVKCGYALPFCVGKSTGPSFSVPVNIQQILSKQPDLAADGTQKSLRAEAFRGSQQALQERKRAVLIKKSLSANDKSCTRHDRHVAAHKQSVLLHSGLLDPSDVQVDADKLAAVVGEGDVKEFTWLHGDSSEQHAEKLRVVLEQVRGELRDLNAQYEKLLMQPVESGTVAESTTSELSRLIGLLEVKSGHQQTLSDHLREVEAAILAERQERENAIKLQWASGVTDKSLSAMTTPHAKQTYRKKVAALRILNEYKRMFDD